LGGAARTGFPRSPLAKAKPRQRPDRALDTKGRPRHSPAGAAAGAMAGSRRPCRSKHAMGSPRAGPRGARAARHARTSAPPRARRPPSSRILRASEGCRDGLAPDRARWPGPARATRRQAISAARCWRARAAATWPSGGGARRRAARASSLLCSRRPRAGFRVICGASMLCGRSQLASGGRDRRPGRSGPRSGARPRATPRSGRGPEPLLPGHA
jgi:hypothetical protein